MLLGHRPVLRKGGLVLSLPAVEEAALEEDPQIVELYKQAAVRVDDTERDKDIELS